MVETQLSWAGSSSPIYHHLLLACCCCPPAVFVFYPPCAVPSSVPGTSVVCVPPAIHHQLWMSSHCVSDVSCLCAPSPGHWSGTTAAPHRHSVELGSVRHQLFSKHFKTLPAMNHVFTASELQWSATLFNHFFSIMCLTWLVIFTLSKTSYFQECIVV